MPQTIAVGAPVARISTLNLEAPFGHPAKPVVETVVTTEQLRGFEASSLRDAIVGVAELPQTMDKTPTALGIFQTSLGYQYARLGAGSDSRDSVRDITLGQPGFEQQFDQPGFGLKAIVGNGKYVPFDGPQFPASNGTVRPLRELIAQA